MLHGRLVLEGAIGCGDERTVRTALAEAEAHGGELAGPVAALTKYADALYKEAVLDMRSLMRHGAGVEKLDQALAKYGEYDFLPPQRWMHNNEHGAAVFLYQ